jgi:hypothetical protein
MRLLVVLLALALVGCGGGNGQQSAQPSGGQFGGGGATVSFATTLDHFAPMFMQGQRLHGIVTTTAGEHYTDWYAQPNNIRWTATQSEQSDIRYCMGKRWSFLLAFLDGPHRYALENVKTTLDDVVLDCPQDGAPYQPFDLPADGTQVVEQWGYVHGDDGSRVFQFYWRASFTYGTQATNPCWQGDGPKTRPVIVQREVWWDSGGGWTRGHPAQEGQLPWVDGAPVKIDVVSDFEIKNAQDAGILWLATPNLCLQNVVTW